MTQRQRRKEELLEKLRSGHWRAREFRAFQDQFGDQPLFEVLLLAFSGSEKRSDDFSIQERAGDLLLELAPRCQGELPDVLRAILGRWNLSIEQLPYYLIDQFGPQAFAAALESMSKDTSQDVEHLTALKSLDYWLRGWLQEESRDTNR